MHIQLLRHATFVVTIKGLKILVDPMLSPAGAMDPVQNATNQRRIPLVGMPVTDDELRRLLDQLNAVLVTHVHRDHWDARARDLLSKQLPVFCQVEDEATFRQAGFSAVHPIKMETEWQGLRFLRTGGQHGTGEVGKKMGTVSGFVLRAEGEPTLYIAGDTIWCPEVREALHTYQPDVVVLYAGEASFLTGGRITMNAEDVLQVCKERPTAKVIAIHMETINHCLLTRTVLKSRLEQAGVIQQVQIPDDGEIISF